MQKNKIFTAVAAAVALSSTSAFAEGDMEKCRVVKDGKGLIKEHRADCKGATHSCAGQNKAGDPESWILVPVGECEKINAGDFSDVSKEIKDKIETTETEIEVG